MSQSLVYLNYMISKFFSQTISECFINASSFLICCFNCFIYWNFLWKLLLSVIIIITMLRDIVRGLVSKECSMHMIPWFLKTYHFINWLRRSNNYMMVIIFCIKWNSRSILTVWFRRVILLKVLFYLFHKLIF